MKAVVLIDNRRVDWSFAKEHGLSMYVEYAGKKCLVDVGLSDGFLANAELLGIDIADVDYLFLTHGHADHVGGLPFFLQKNKKAKVYVAENALTQKYFSTRRGLKDISPNFKSDLLYTRMHYVCADMEVEAGIHLVFNKEHNYAMPYGNLFLHQQIEGCLVTDDFAHELIVTFGQDQLLVCCGCAHNGLLNMLQSVRNTLHSEIRWVIGGFHLLDVDDMSQYESKEEIAAVGQELKTQYPNTHFYTGHCTGDEPFLNLKSILGDKLEQFYAGKEIEFKQ